MVENTPFCSTTLWLKRVDAELLNETGARAMKYAFPMFLTSEQFQSSALKANQIWPGDGQERRFAGDQNLPRGRYYTVARDETGDDQGTLTDELEAYSDPARVGPVRLQEIDLRSEGLVNTYRQQGLTVPEHGRALGVQFLPVNGAPHPFAVAH